MISPSVWHYQDKEEVHLGVRSDMKNANYIKKIVAIVICALIGALMICILAINLSLIIKGNLNKELPPDIAGTAPLAVVSPSMAGDKEDSFDEGALVYIKLLDDNAKQTLKLGDIVCFRDKDSQNQTVFVTHRIVAINTSADGTIESVVTMGDANNATDGTIALSKVIGKCTGHVDGLGNFAMFLQTPLGIVVFVGIPVLLFIVWDVIRIILRNKKQRDDEEAQQSKDQIAMQQEEIRRLQAQLDEQRRNEQEGSVFDDTLAVDSTDNNDVDATNIE